MPPPSEHTFEQESADLSLCPRYPTSSDPSLAGARYWSPHQSRIETVATDDCFYDSAQVFVLSESHDRSASSQAEQPTPGPSPTAHRECPLSSEMRQRQTSAHSYPCIPAP